MNVNKEELKETIRKYCLENIKDCGDKRRRIVDFEVVIEEESLYSDDGFCSGNYDVIKIRCITETLKRKIKSWETVWIA